MKADTAYLRMDRKLLRTRSLEIDVSERSHDKELRHGFEPLNGSAKCSMWDLTGEALQDSMLAVQHDKSTPCLLLYPSDRRNKFALHNYSYKLISSRYG